MTTGNTKAAHPAGRSGILGWMFFDWAAQPFFTVITTFIFGPYLVSRMAADPVAGQAAWSYTLTISGIVIALLSPVLGSIADASGRRKPWIAAFAVVQIVSVWMLWFAVPGTSLLLPLTMMVLATVAAEFSIVFNDSMMPTLVPPDETGRISNLAWGLGYVGGTTVLIAVILFIAANPATGLTALGIAPVFGLDAAMGEDARVTGPLSAVWYLVFILPMFLFTPDRGRGLPLRQAVRSGLASIGDTLTELKERRGILRFLIARMFYQDGLNGLLALGGTFAAGMFAWQTMELGIYGIILNVVAIGGCFWASRLDSRLGSKSVVVASLACLIVATLGIVSTAPEHTLFGLLPLPSEDSGGLFGTAAEKAYIVYGLLVGIAFGPVQASARSYLARSVAPEEAGRYFGLYALTGRATSFAAPLSVGIVTSLTGSAALGMGALVVFLVIGLVLLLRTPYPADRPATPAAVAPVPFGH
ncbi:MFS transporter [Rhizobium sp. GN54]|uniref:MFS transporter n=1 Tax=Rhizobium sp. GN54 TaxID=2898150 RepID=UPI001E36BA0F|nr:MFS transporter [Rhizobium sp. GN54]MCD2182590.1 MFS transporter [Rhizobium sp. GN54]